ncbi:hypothetical protein D3C86_1641450 [compost metagenome]
MQGKAKLLDPFRDNLFRRKVDEATGEKITEKSCPKCSKKAGTTIYYPESAFQTQDGSAVRAASLRDCAQHRRPGTTVKKAAE